MEILTEITLETDMPIMSIKYGNAIVRRIQAPTTVKVSRLLNPAKIK